MPDITLCKGKNCPLKETCHRYLAKPFEFRQSYFMEPPFQIVEGEPKCDYYWEINNKKNESSDT
jgi:hypothetical protein